MENSPALEAREVVVHGSATGFAQSITVANHRLTADEPVAVGGTDTGPGPYDLLLAALGSCTSMTVALYARRKQWPLEAVTVRLRHSRIHAKIARTARRRSGGSIKSSGGSSWWEPSTRTSERSCSRLPTNAPCIGR
jgi:organic hydroperoxide reductase OsmC/OhrA